MASDRNTVRTIAAANVATDLLDRAAAMVAELRALAAGVETGESVIERAIGAADALASEMASLRDDVSRLVTGIGVPHRWDGTRLQLVLPGGGLSAAVDLQGEPGADADPAALIDDASAKTDRTWSAARIRLALDALRLEIETGALVPKTRIPAGVGTGLLLALPQPEAFSAAASASATGPPPAEPAAAPAGIATGLLAALPLSRSPSA